MPTTSFCSKTSVAKSGMISSLLFVILVSCRSGQGVQVDYESRPATQLNGQRNGAAVAHDPIAKSLGIRPLRQVILPVDNRELRLSTGAGMIFGAQYGVLRIIERGPVAQGEVWLYRGVAARDGSTLYKVRRVRLSPNPEWKQLLARFDSLRADRIEVPSDGSSYSDAGELYVESLSGAAYRATSVNAPRLRKGAEARIAAAAAALIDSLVREGSEQY
jgi:hypothetical protein